MGKKNIHKDKTDAGIKASARIIAPDSDINEILNLPADSEAYFLGEKPIYADPKTTSSNILPAKFLSHRLIQDRYFFALPLELWDRLYKTFDNKTINKEIVELEIAASRICKDCFSDPGLYSGKAFACSLLQPLPPKLSAQTAAAKSEEARKEAAHIRQWVSDLKINNVKLAWVNDAKLALDIERLNARQRPIDTVIGGYVGWLMTNKHFLDEHDAIISKWTGMVQRWGFSRLGVFTPKRKFSPDPTADPQWSAYHQEFEEFLTRWRLKGLAAPYLPVPLGPLVAGSLHSRDFSQFIRAGGVFCYPDTFPLSSKDKLRNLLEGALHCGTPPSHLKEWMKLIASDKETKMPIARRFDRLFKLQHYYRTLHHRHPNVFQRRKIKAMQQKLADFLNISETTLENDLEDLRKQLGKNWLDRGQSLSIGPF